MTPRSARAPAIAAMAALVAAACTTGSPTPPGTASSLTPSGSAPSALIPQPTPPSGLPSAPDNMRVDLTRPTFSDPTNVTNPLFPVSSQASVLHLGAADGEPLRTEVTTLPYSYVLDWDGQRLEVLVSQYTLYLGGRITEAAIDRYAQADDGSVWYFGEDVYRYADGVVFDTDGTWLAGKDGPPALIMPGKPTVGQAFRPENIPGLVFEEVTVTAVDRTIDGPRGPIPGGLAASEVHSDGTTSEKLFAPGYGEVYTSSATELETMALAVPTDALPGPMPSELTALATAAGAIADAAATQDWAGAATQLDALRTVWTTLRGGDVPARTREFLETTLTTLTEAATAHDQTRAGQAAIDALRYGLDLQLRHRPPAEIDLARMDVWARQLLLDLTDADPSGLVHGDVAALKYVRDRLLGHLNRADVSQIDQHIHDLAEAAEDTAVPSLEATTDALRDTLAAIQPGR